MFFSELIHRTVPHDPSDIAPVNDDLPTDCDPSTKKETYQAVKQLKNNKSAEPDSIPAEALEMDVETSVELL